MRERMIIPNHRNHVIDHVPQSVTEAERYLRSYHHAFYCRIAHYRNTHDEYWQDKIANIPEGIRDIVMRFVNVCKYVPIIKGQTQIIETASSVKYVGKAQFNPSR